MRGDVQRLPAKRDDVGTAPSGHRFPRAALLGGLVGVLGVVIAALTLLLHSGGPAILPRETLRQGRSRAMVWASTYAPPRSAKSRPVPSMTNPNFS